MESLLDRLDMGRLLTQLVEFIPDLLAALIIIAAFWIVFRVTSKPLQTILERAGLHATLVRMLIDNIYRFTLLIFGLVMAADQIGINVGAALAGIGVVGIALGFAAQDSLANIIAGFLIFIDKPFEVGDWVRVDNEYGQVNNITMRTTRIRTKRNTYVVIPNKMIIDTVLENHSKHGVTRVDVPVGIAYKESILQAREVLLEAVSKIGGIAKDPAPDVVVTEMAGSSVNMNVRVWIDEAADEQPVYFRVMEASKLSLDAAGIEIPYPHMQLFVENVEDRVWKSALQGLSLNRPTKGGPEKPVN
ncbi:MAG: mechanosensitive ion channel family protein [Bryobacterales bacterium]